jgi:hypothetical protein
VIKGMGGEAPSLAGAMKEAADAEGRCVASA